MDDSAAHRHEERKKFINNIFQQAYNSIRRTPSSGPEESYLNVRSEQAYMPYQGKMIRHIEIVPVNFDRSFRDTAARDRSLAARVGNRLHISTRKFVIRNNLFIRENTPVNAYMVADNERFIRGQEYMNDARIIIDSIPGNPDSVDVRVYTKDLFSIGGGMAANGLERINADLYDANLAGMGQRLSLNGLYDKNREPQWGYGGYYRKNNVGHTYIDATVGHSVMNVNPYTRTEETVNYLTLDRRLVSPYSRFAGGLTLGEHKAYNLYGRPDSIFYAYSYHEADGWAGYSVGINKLTATNNNIRDRRFLAIRMYQRDMTNVPARIGENFHPVFNSSRAALAQFTFFRQDFYKTQYIYGFGTTEDLPYGYNFALTTGLHEQLDLRRPYAGANATWYTSTGWGDFLKVYLKAGGFMHRGSVQDGSILLGATSYSPMLFWGGTRIRQYVNLSYTHLWNRVTYAPLYINNYYGLRGFLSDSAYGTRRLSLQLETAFYLKYKLLGFRFAPFPWADLTLITPENAAYRKTALYSALGGGIRTRNENLVFETIEVRAYFFPVAPPGMRGFKVIANTNIRFRYRNNYITAPDVVQLNQE
ncbi:hypothetical protein GCM10023093_15840 [Nemorincola caseinilytica]|uniref:Uncharacterized protein n=2 Tax=Nemorincola caseinilytica TaxID=2054315 RepID=A0ABP8NBY9_9BACT